MGRPKLMKKSVTVALRIDKDLYEEVKEIAALESLHTGRVVTTMQLMRDAIEYVYTDNERLRECFKRSRAHITGRWT